MYAVSFRDKLVDAEARYDRAIAAHRKWWAPLVEFVVHMVVGTTIFLIIALAAVAIHTVNKFVGGDGWIALGLRAMEFTVFAVDLVLFLIYIIRVTISVSKALWTNDSWR